MLSEFSVADGCCEIKPQNQKKKNRYCLFVLHVFCEPNVFRTRFAEVLPGEPGGHLLFHNGRGGRLYIIHPSTQAN
jgi:hypothetical protein